jgi:hypothetical protein
VRGGACAGNLLMRLNSAGNPTAMEEARAADGAWVALPGISNQILAARWRRLSTEALERGWVQELGFAQERWKVGRCARCEVWLLLLREGGGGGQGARKIGSPIEIGVA